MAWHTEDKKINPANGTLLADTGPLSADTYGFSFTVAASVLTVVMIQRRNVANDANISQFRIVTGAGNTVHLPKGSLSINDGERIRIVLDGAIAGQTQATIDDGK